MDVRDVEARVGVFTVCSTYNKYVVSEREVRERERERERKTYKQRADKLYTFVAKQNKS